MLKTVIDQKVPWCLHCGKDKWAEVRRYEMVDDLPTGRWLGDRQAVARGLEIADDEQIEHVWCSGCGLLYHSDSI